MSLSCLSGILWVIYHHHWTTAPEQLPSRLSPLENSHSRQFPAWTTVINTHIQLTPPQYFMELSCVGKFGDNCLGWKLSRWEFWMRGCGCKFSRNHIYHTHRPRCACFSVELITPKVELPPHGIVCINVMYLPWACWTKLYKLLILDLAIQGSMVWFLSMNSFQEYTHVQLQIPF